MTIQCRDLSRRYKRPLFLAFQFIETLRELRPDMPMQMVSILLLVAMKPGISQRDLLGLLDISQASISRNVAALTKTDRHGRSGLDSITQRSDPGEWRSPALYLTPAGDAFLRRPLAVGLLRE